MSHQIYMQKLEFLASLKSAMSTLSQVVLHGIQLQINNGEPFYEHDCEWIDGMIDAIPDRSKVPNFKPGVLN